MSTAEVAPKHYVAGYVVLSFFISAIGSCSTLELLQRRTAGRGLYNWYLLVGSAVTMGGIGISQSFPLRIHEASPEPGTDFRSYLEHALCLQPHMSSEPNMSNTISAHLQIGNRATVLYDGEPELQLAYSPEYTALSFFVPIFVLLGAYSLAGTGDDGSKLRVIFGGVFAGSRFVGINH